jgi:hypothetical protein
MSAEAPSTTSISVSAAVKVRAGLMSSLALDLMFPRRRLENGNPNNSERPEEGGLW